MDSESALDLRFNKPEIKYSRSEILHKIVTKLSSKNLESTTSNHTTAINLTQNRQPVPVVPPQPNILVVEKFPNSTINPHFDVNFNAQKYINPPQNSNISTTETQNIKENGNLSENPEIQSNLSAPEDLSAINFDQSCNSSPISCPITFSVEVEVEKDQNMTENIVENLSMSEIGQKFVSTNGIHPKAQLEEPKFNFPITTNDLQSPVNDKAEAEIDEMPILQCENEAGSETTEFDEAEEKTQKFEQNSNNFGYIPALKRGRGRPRLNPTTSGPKVAKKSVKMGTSHTQSRHMAEFLKKKELMLWGKRENQGQPPQRFQYLVISKEKKRKKFKMSNGFGYFINSSSGLQRKRGRPRKIHDNSNGNQVNGNHAGQDNERVPVQNDQNIQIVNIDTETEDSDCEENIGDFNLGSLLFDDKEFTDIDLMVGDEIFKAHKYVLASQSEYFSDLCKQVDRITFIPEVKPEIFIIILNFMYKGKVKLLGHGIENLIEIFNLAAKFKIKKLLQLSINQLNKFRGFSPEIGIRLMEIASDFGDSEEILQTLLKSIPPIYKEIKKLKKWKEMVENPKYLKVIQKLVLILDFAS